MKLQEFYNDKETMKVVHEYLTQFLEEEAIRMVFERENVDAIADAKEILDKGFENLSVLFNPKVKKKSQDNEAR